MNEKKQGCGKKEIILIIKEIVGVFFKKNL